MTLWIPTWDSAKGEWVYTTGKAAKPAANPPLRPGGLGPFEMPVARNKPLPADHKGVVAVGQAVARMR